MNHHPTPLRKPEIIAKDLDGETILYSAGHQQLHILNPTAQVIWELCDGKHSHTDIEQVLRSRFAVAPHADVLTDVKEIITVFAKKGLLQGTS
ncbi:MAG: PqqD family protein [Chloroflexi bacterium]|nr:MAG: PqqD family protein [Chloroflexota bacterium]